MTDTNGPASSSDEPQAPSFGAPSPHAPAPGQPAQPFSSPASGAAHQAGAPGQQQTGAPFGAPGQQPGQQYGAPGQQQGQQFGAPGQQYGAPGQQQGQQYGAPGGQYGAPQYGAPGQPQYATGAPMSPQDEKQWAMFGHLGGLLWIVGLGWVGPLIVFLVYKDRSPFVRQESKEALNFQIFMTILGVGISVLAFILGLVTILIGGIGSLIGAFAGIPVLLGVIFAIIGGVRVNAGGSYRYPFNWRIIK